MRFRLFWCFSRRSILYQNLIVKMLDSREKLAFRVVSIGDSSVGKTSIINRFLRDTFEPEEPETIGVLYDSFIQEVNGATVEIQLWDTAGQEQYRSLGPVYFRSAGAAIVVFDLTNEESFRSIGDWINSFRNVCRDSAIVIVVGNKSERTDRTVQADEAKAWAKEHNASYVETSAKTGQGVKVLFDELVALLAPSIVDVAESRSSLDLQSSLNEKKGCC
jgi:small GTP-binding protein